MNVKGGSEVVRWEQSGDVLVVTINNPPVNALAHGVRHGLMEAIDAAQASAGVKAILIAGAGRHFIAGADIREFGKPKQPPALSEVCDRLESSEKLVVAAIHGVALGGGLEVALSAHYRLAVAGASLGLPEVNIGLLPGAGGTQRTPRLVGVANALDIMLSGRHLGGEEALSIGLIDRCVADVDAVTAGLAYAQELIRSAAPRRRTRDAQALADKAASHKQVEAARAATAKRSRGLFSPMKIIECVSAAIDLPFDEGMALETRLFRECLNSPQRAGLIHVFFAEREVSKIPEARSAEPRKLNSVAVIGGGTMGVGITVSTLNAGYPVVMLERDDQALAQARAKVDQIYARQVAQGRLDAADKDAAMARFTGTVSYDDIANVDLVIEAVFEDLNVKTAVFKELDRVCKPGAVLATNTSTLDVNLIASSTSRPADVIGLHFFSPAHVMRLLEVVVPDHADPAVVVTAFEFARKIKKTAVRAGVCDGFIGNRILAAYKQAADYLMEDGASPYEIDAAVRDFGYPMGPFEVTDLAIVDAGRKRAGITPRTFSPEEIMRRYMAAMVNEAANVVHEGIALRPLDVDVTFVSGYGFPRYRGGPMYWADSIGLDKILADIESFAPEAPLFWQPSPLLVQLVKEGRNFDSLNRLSD